MEHNSVINIDDLRRFRANGVLNPLLAEDRERTGTIKVFEGQPCLEYQEVSDTYRRMGWVHTIKFIDCLATSEDIEVISTFDWIETLHLRQLSYVDLMPLSRMSNLKNLFLNFTWHSRKIHNIEFVRTMTNLRSLDLTYTCISDLSPLETCKELFALNLWNTEVEDLTPLAGLHKLKHLTLFDTKVKSLDPIQHLIDSGLQVFGFGQKSNVVPNILLVDDKTRRAEEFWYS